MLIAKAHLKKKLKALSCMMTIVMIQTLILFSVLADVFNKSEEGVPMVIEPPE
jgi:hypothetical protein